MSAQKRRNSEESEEPATKQVRRVTDEGVEACELTLATTNVDVVHNHAATEALMEQPSSQSTHRDQQVADLQQELSSAKEAYNRLLSQIEHESNQRHQQNQWATNTITGLDSDVHRLETELAQQDRELAKLRADNASLSSQNEQLNEDVRRFQQTAFGALDNARWMPMDNDTVSSDLSRLRKAINNIAKAYAIEDFSGLVNHTDESRLSLRKQLSDAVRFISKGVEGLNELTTIRHGPRLCLSSIISNFIHDVFFNRPFFVVDPDADDGDIRGGRMRLSTLYSRGLKG